MKRGEYHSPEKFVMLHDKMEHYMFIKYWIIKKLEEYNSGQYSLEAVLGELDILMRTYERDIKRINEDIKKLESEK
jgi:hypothetical protein